MTRMFQILGNSLASPTDTLKIRCSACGHEVAWSARRAIATFGAHAAPFDLTSKLVCSRCNQRRVTAWI